MAASTVELPLAPVGAVVAAPVEGWNPYFVAWAHSQGVLPEAAPERPGWRYLNWISEQWAAWSLETGIDPIGKHAFYSDRFGRWLAARWPAPSGAPR